MTCNWNDLSDKLKWMVVDKMDIITRFRLKMCSKSDKCLVEQVPFEYLEVQVHSNKRSYGDNAFQQFVIRFDLSSLICVCLDSLPRTIEIRKANKERFIKLSTEEECSEMIRCMFRAFMLPQNVRIKRFFTFLYLDCLFSNPGFKLHVKTLELNIGNREESENLLNLLATTPEEMKIYKTWEGMGEHPVVKNVNSLSIFEQNDIDDEQLMNLKATRIYICSFKITDKGINKLAKKMIKEDYPIGSRFNVVGLGLKTNIIRTPGSEWSSLLSELNSEPMFTERELYYKARVIMSPTKQLIITRICGSVEFLVVKRGNDAEELPIQTHKKNWNDLPDEVKEKIVDRMDIFTRFRLKMCSKTDKCLVDTVPFDCDFVMIGDVNPVGVSLQNFRTSYFKVDWNDATSTLSIKREKSKRFIRLSSAEERIEMIKYMFLAFMSPQNVRIGRFHASTNFTYLFPSSDFKLHVKKLDLRVKNREENEKWLNALANQPEELDIFNECNGIETHPVVKGVNILQMQENSDIDDDQLMQLQARTLHLKTSLVTENGINKLAKKMIDEDYPIGSKMSFNCSLTFNWDRVIEGLNAGPTDIHPIYGMSIRVNMSAEKDLIVCPATNGNRDYAHILVVVPKNAY